VKSFVVGNLATIAPLFMVGCRSLLSLIIIFVQVGGYSAVKAGMALMPVTIIMFCFPAVLAPWQVWPPIIYGGWTYGGGTPVFCFNAGVSEHVVWTPASWRDGIWTWPFT